MIERDGHIPEWNRTPEKELYGIGKNQKKNKVFMKFNRCCKTVFKTKFPTELAEIILEKPPISNSASFEYLSRCIPDLFSGIIHKEISESVESALTHIDFDTIIIQFIHSTPSEYKTSEVRKNFIYSTTLCKFGTFG